MTQFFSLLAQSHDGHERLLQEATREILTVSQEVTLPTAFSTRVKYGSFLS